jgi:hypothetical protein
MAEPEPRQAAAVKELHAATDAVEKAMEAYRKGGSVEAVNKADRRLAMAHHRMTGVVSAGRIDDFRDH